jgi:DNA-binding PadR family transcriptional regulator
MVRGKSSREELTREILRLASDKQPHPSSDLVSALKGQFCKVTVYSNLNKLVDEKLLQVELEKTDYGLKPRYKITVKGLSEAERLTLLRDFMQEISSLSVDELKLEIMRWRKIAEFLSVWGSMNVEQRIRALSVMAEQGNFGAKEWLEKIAEKMGSERKTSKP